LTKLEYASKSESVSGKMQLLYGASQNTSMIIHANIIFAIFLAYQD